MTPNLSTAMGYIVNIVTSQTQHKGENDEAVTIGVTTVTRY